MLIISSSALYHHIIDQMQYANAYPTVGGCFFAAVPHLAVSHSIRVVRHLFLRQLKTAFKMCIETHAFCSVQGGQVLAG